LADSIRWVLSTPFGAPVDPEVKRIFATVSGRSAPKAARAGRAWHGGQQVLEPVGARPAARADDGRHRGHSVQRGREPVGVVGEHGPGVDQFGDRPDPLVISALQRIRDADRCHRHPGGHRAERKQQVAHAVRTGL
jgi:hypothetical protein